MDKKQQENIIEEMFFEERMPKENDEGVLNESFDESHFQEKEEILRDIKNFWTLSTLFQRKMVKNLPLILEKIEPENFLLCIQNLYTDKKHIIEDNFEVATLMIQ